MRTKNDTSHNNRKNLLSEHFISEKQRMIEECIECGLCAEVCPIISKTSLKDMPSTEIQRQLKTCLELDEPNETAHTRAFSCMECFGCIENVCPVDLNPFITNLIARQVYRQNGWYAPEYSLPNDHQYANRIIASVQVSPDEYHRIFTPSPAGKAKAVFFPGCNVYTQPEKVLNALDILDLAGEKIAFVPGLEYCCGNAPLGYGVLRDSEALFSALIEKVSEYEPEVLILWCPTCQCQLEKIIKPILDLPFDFITLTQYLTNRVTLPPFREKMNVKITLHEACKSAFTGLDLVGPRTLLNKIDGLELVEMQRHGKETSCCGSGAATYFKDAMQSILNERMIEAESTGADLLVDVCHYCHYLFSVDEDHYPFSTKNYIQILAEAYGIRREDRMLKWRRLKDINRIMEDAETFIKTSPFPRNLVQSVLEAWIAGP